MKRELDKELTSIIASALESISKLIEDIHKDIKECITLIEAKNKLHEEKPESYTAGQVMEILHISRNTLCKYHKLGYIKREANNRYNASDVETLRTTCKGTYVRKL